MDRCAPSPVGAGLGSDCRHRWVWSCQTHKRRASKSVRVALFPLLQVGSNDLTLVNLHLTTLTLPGGENPSKNHSDSHRLSTFAQSLQETLKGRKLSSSMAGPPAPAPAGSGLFLGSLQSLRMAILSAAVHREGTGDGHIPCMSWRPAVPAHGDVFVSAGLACTFCSIGFVVLLGQKRLGKNLIDNSPWVQLPPVCHCAGATCRCVCALLVKDRQLMTRGVGRS